MAEPEKIFRAIAETADEGLGIRDEGLESQVTSLFSNPSSAIR